MNNNQPLLPEESYFNFTKRWVKTGVLPLVAAGVALYSFGYLTQHIKADQNLYYRTPPGLEAYMAQIMIEETNNPVDKFLLAGFRARYLEELTEK